jgi:cation diffusion facilitator CzcD-associated flavoprotein CzcO
MASISKGKGTDFDTIIVGAGISGINAAYRVQTELPSYSYTILESRSAIGGTWDLFRYPGIRSDSDLHTFGFSWRPWSEPKAIADGESIRTYIRESAEAYGIDKNIQYHRKLIAANWSSDTQKWNLLVEFKGEKSVYTARFLVLSTGYYDYNEPLKAEIPGIDKFKGQIIHPQSWPEDLDYTNKKIVIIGSGATAITLLPNLTSKAAHVTMLQRSPGYILALPSVDPSGNFFRKIFPAWLAFKLVRWKFLLLPFFFFQFCRFFPNAARRAIQANTQSHLPAGISHDPDFKPKYNPWEQRLCVCPDGDFYKALASGKADIVTDTIKTITETGIVTENGTELDADIIVTATGLKMLLAGGARMTVNEKPIPISERFMWKSAMMQDVPNLVFMIGYTNASWTLGADTSALLLCNLCKYMDERGMGSATPKVKEGARMGSRSILNLNSTYIEKAKGMLPKAGNVAPWKPRDNYFLDMWGVNHGLTKDIEFISR